MPLDMTPQSSGSAALSASAAIPSFKTVITCYLLLASVLLSPLAFRKTKGFSDTQGRRIKWHLHYIRVTCIGAWVGASGGIAGLFIGANLVGSALQAGLLLIALTAFWAYYRTLYGLSCALRHRPLRDHKTWFV